MENKTRMPTIAEETTTETAAAEECGGEFYLEYKRWSQSVQDASERMLAYMQSRGATEVVVGWGFTPPATVNEVLQLSFVRELGLKVMSIELLKKDCTVAMNAKDVRLCFYCVKIKFQIIINVRENALTEDRIRAIVLPEATDAVPTDPPVIWGTFRF